MQYFDFQSHYPFINIFFFIPFILFIRMDHFLI